MEILPCSSSPCCYVNLKGKLVAKSSNTNKSKLQTFRKGRILFAKIECVNGSLRFHNLGQSFLRNPNHQGGFGSSNAHQSDKHVDSKVLSGSYNGYVIDGEEDARTLSETGKSGTKVLIPGLPDESSGESAAPIRSCFWQWKPKFNVHYEKTGCENVTSPPVLFLPGFGVGSFHYDKQLKDLGRDHSVWAIDFLGQGMSLPFEGPTPMSKEGVASDKKDQARGFGDETEPWASELVYSMDLWQDQVRYFIEQVIGEPVYLVGNSLGGYVALYFAACNPHLVKGVTLLNATPFWGFLPNSIKSPRLARLFPWAGTFPLPSRLVEKLDVAFIVGREIGCGISELKSLDLHGELKITNLENVRNGVGSVKDANLKDKRHIHSLKFIWEDVADVSLRENVIGVIEALQPSSELKKLTIENYMGSKFPSWLMNHYLTNLVELSLIKCCRCVQLPSLGKLPLLEFLTIDEMDATMYFCSDSKENTGVADVVSLKRPSLKSMPNLLGWSSAEGRVILSCLKELEDILMNVTEMTSPSNITLGGFEELVDLPQGLLSNKTGLLSFEIKDCPKLVNFSGELNSLSLLQSLSISNCPNIKCLSELGVLKALKSLAIDRCHGLLSLPEEEIQGLTSLQHFSLSNRENITVLPYTMQQFTNLQTLHIWSCPKVDSLPEWLGNLVSLRELELWYCENLLYLPESMQGLTALQFLSIWGCPQLEIHLEKDRGPDCLKQHNGELKGGAKASRAGRPWICACLNRTEVKELNVELPNGGSSF
ncbi:hypothetical protein FEM48_ZijujUnG0074200 [Ziziphus jujuba var. spinosa]|uniref:AB hydrolase-1 domain-containing protein n=1 Tax=Ziziphus jujuba var. spinosa TaxID=714518 RepID=A0A978U8T8_ZIZJJ|nr:hypothetical protein FEM48_ZijujUnG0074200 [Ziziphus jujuba var. spinosa]